MCLVSLRGRPSATTFNKAFFNVEEGRQGTDEGQETVIKYSEVDYYVQSMI